MYNLFYEQQRENIDNVIVKCRVPFYLVVSLITSVKQTKTDLNTPHHKLFSFLPIRILSVNSSFLQNDLLQLDKANQNGIQCSILSYF